MYVKKSANRTAEIIREFINIDFNKIGPASIIDKLLVSECYAISNCNTLTLVKPYIAAVEIDIYIDSIK
jgi:hypothetical protein